MALRNKLLSVLDVVLRVPPIFVMDAILISGFGGVPRSFYFYDNSTSNGDLVRKTYEPGASMFANFNGSTSTGHGEHGDFIYDEPKEEPTMFAELLWASFNLHGEFRNCIIDKHV